jgi:membrane protease YdiL (CAAX protease family)
MNSCQSPQDVYTLVRPGLAALCVAFASVVVATAASSQMSATTLLFAKSLVVAPLIEEFFFRGVVQSRLRAGVGFWAQPWSAIAVTAACFGAAHLLAGTPEHALMVVAPAIAIGWAYERTRSIGLCVALHSAANGVWLFYWSR